MTPELQQILDSQQEALRQAQFKMNFLAYSTYAAIIICAVFSVLIFWKLCQIQKQLRLPATREKTALSPSAVIPIDSPIPPRQDDSKYMPKK